MKWRMESTSGLVPSHFSLGVVLSNDLATPSLHSPVVNLILPLENKVLFLHRSTISSIVLALQAQGGCFKEYSVTLVARAQSKYGMKAFNSK